MLILYYKLNLIVIFIYLFITRNAKIIDQSEKDQYLGLISRIIEEYKYGQFL